MSDQTCAICGGKHETPKSGAFWDHRHLGECVKWLQGRIAALEREVGEMGIAVQSDDKRIAALEAEAQTRKDDGK